MVVGMALARLHAAPGAGETYKAVAARAHTLLSLTATGRNVIAEIYQDGTGSRPLAERQRTPLTPMNALPESSKATSDPRRSRQPMLTRSSVNAQDRPALVVSHNPLSFDARTRLLLVGETASTRIPSRRPSWKGRRSVPQSPWPSLRRPPNPASVRVRIKATESAGESDAASRWRTGCDNACRRRRFIEVRGIRTNVLSSRRWNSKMGQRRICDMNADFRIVINFYHPPSGVSRAMTCRF